MNPDVILCAPGVIDGLAAASVIAYTLWLLWKTRK